MTKIELEAVVKSTKDAEAERVVKLEKIASSLKGRWAPIAKAFKGSSDQSALRRSMREAELETQEFLAICRDVIRERAELEELVRRQGAPAQTIIPEIAR